MLEKNDVIESLNESGYDAIHYLIDRLTDYGEEGVELPKDVMKIRTGFFPGEYVSVDKIAIRTTIPVKYPDLEDDELVVKLSNDVELNPLSIYTSYQTIDWMTLIHCVDYAISLKENKRLF